MRGGERGGEGPDSESGPNSKTTRKPRRREPRWRELMKESGLLLTLENSGSVARDHLASERTFLAYARTSLTIASTGVGASLSRILFQRAVLVLTCARCPCLRSSSPRAAVHPSCDDDEHPRRAIRAPPRGSHDWPRALHAPHRYRAVLPYPRRPHPRQVSCRASQPDTALRRPRARRHCGLRHHPRRSMTPARNYVEDIRESWRTGGRWEEGFSS